MSRIKRTYEQVKEEFKQRGYELVSGEYHKESDYLDYLCTKHKKNGIQRIRASHFHDGSGCKYCGREQGGKNRIKMSIEQVRMIFKERGYELKSSEFSGMRSRLQYVCLLHKDKGIQITNFVDFYYNNTGCYYCGREKHAKACHRTTYEEVKKEFLERDYELVSTEFNGVEKRLDYICNKHRENGVQHTTYSRFKKSGCRFCATERIVKANTTTLDEFQEKIASKNPNVAALEYSNCRKTAKFQCKKCGYVWESSAHTMLAYGKKCPNCEHASKGEARVGEILDDWGIKFNGQHRFRDCYDLRPLPFDYYLPEYNVCIEYDGEQHFRKINHWSNYEKTIKHDQMKNEFCVKNNIPLIRIPYWEEADMEYYLFDKFVEYGIILETFGTD